jgi:uncharacterized protein (DUF2147 family)
MTLAALLVALAVPAADAQQQPQRKGAQAAVPVPPAPETSPSGIWIDHTGRGAVEIAPCVPGAAPGTPEAANLCGRIVWMKDPNDPKGQPLRDTLNKNAARRGQPICGLQIIGDVKPQANGSWDKGWIYDPEQGSSFDLELRLRNPETLQVKGYMGVKFLSETFVWRRAREAPPKCSGA